MISHEILIEGTLRPDGTLELDGKPNLPPGRVQVILRQEATPVPAVEGWWEFMQRTRWELEAAGSQFMNDEEVTDHIAWLREGDSTDERLRQTELPR